MKVGMNLLLWTTHLTEEYFPLLQKLRETGFDGVEVFVGEGNLPHYQAMRRELGNQGLACSAVTSVDPEANPASPNPAVRRAASERLKWAVDMSAALGADVLCGPFHSAYAVFPGHPPTGDERRWSSEVLREVAEYAQNTGIVLAVENLNRFECYLLTTVQQARDLVEVIGHPALGILYDTHHAHIEEKDSAEAIRQAAAQIKHVHISENDRGTPGRGQVDWEGNFRALREIGYDGWLVIESFSRHNPDFASAIHVWRDFASSPEEVYQEGLRFIRRMWADTAEG